MHYDHEKAFLENVLSKMRVRTATLSETAFISYDHDFGLRKMIGSENNAVSYIAQNLYKIKSKTIYFFQDWFSFAYILLRLPDDDKQYFFIGPFLDHPVHQEEMLECANLSRLPASKLSKLKSYYQSVPVISDRAYLLALLSAFGETIWGSASEFELVSLNLADIAFPAPEYSAVQESESGDLSVLIQHMEIRYQYENELMHLVSKGLVHRAENMLNQFSEYTIEQRAQDPLRNFKNYAVICNTLLRKACENGGVHPFDLNRISTDYAHVIESSLTPERVKDTMIEMLRSYCRAVRKHRLRSYSLPVQKVILFIENNLSAPLTLKAIAKEHNLNHSYLSDLFHRETGQTIIQYITEKRLDLAAKLLKDTHLSIQAVAQQCGINDVNYFSKLFKKAYNVSPRKHKMLLLSPKVPNP